jgi:tetratricopeptide (TPR) repeat protein
MHTRLTFTIGIASFLAGVILLVQQIQGITSESQNAEQLLDAGLRQMAGARAQRSDAALQLAQDTFTKVLEQDHDNPRGLIHHGEAETERGLLAQAAGNARASSMLFQRGMSDMDRAIRLAPEELDLRLVRGWMFAPWPPIVGTSRIAIDDLERVVRHPKFKSLSGEQRAHTFDALGIAYSTAGQIEKARMAFRTGIDAAPESSFGRDAALRLTRVAKAGFVNRFLDLNLSWLGWPHSAACLVAMAAFFVVMFARKGGRIHRQWGRVYVIAYAVACLTALGIYRTHKIIFAHWLAIGGLIVLAAGYLAVRFKPRGWRYIHFVMLLLSAYNLFGGAVTEAFLRIKPLSAWAGGVATMGMIQGMVMLIFIALILAYIILTAVRSPRRRGQAILERQPEGVR